MPPLRHPDPHALQFGMIVARLRMQRGWTLVDLAKATRLNPVYLSVLEHGRNNPTLTTIFRLAQAFGVEPAELIREVDRKMR